MYIVNDTVEEAIYDISVKRRLAHIRSDVVGDDHHHHHHHSSSSASAGSSISTSVEPAQASRDTDNKPTEATIMESDIDAANSLELRQAAPLKHLVAKGRGGGEFVDNAYLWRCLFSNSHRSGGGTAGHAHHEAVLASIPTDILSGDGHDDDEMSEGADGHGHDDDDEMGEGADGAVSMAGRGEGGEGGNAHGEDPSQQSSIRDGINSLDLVDLDDRRL